MWTKEQITEIKNKCKEYGITHEAIRDRMGKEMTRQNVTSALNNITHNNAIIEMAFKMIQEAKRTIKKNDARLKRA